MRRHRLAGGTSALEGFVTIGAEIIEDLAKLKLTKLAELGFRLVKTRQELLEAEGSAEGRELAYFVRLQDRFPQTLRD
jgi:hypothetical protein